MEETHATCAMLLFGVLQTVKVVAEGDKYKSLIRLLGKELGKAEAGPSPAPARIIVFAGTKAGVDEVSSGRCRSLQ
jgi:hypothetical protein